MVKAKHILAIAIFVAMALVLFNLMIGRGSSDLAVPTYPQQHGVSDEIKQNQTTTNTRKIESASISGVEISEQPTSQNLDNRTPFHIHGPTGEFETIYIPERIVNEVNVYANLDASMVSGAEFREMIWRMGAENPSYGNFALSQLSREHIEVLGQYFADEFRILYVTNEEQAEYASFINQSFSEIFNPRTQEEIEKRDELVQRLENRAMELFDTATLQSISQTHRLWPHH